MKEKKNIIGICGSASEDSSNLFILKWLSIQEEKTFNFEIINSLTDLPLFKTAYTDEKVPEEIKKLRSKIANADGVIICTPEYVFSIPSNLKNMIEWCVSTTVFSKKSVGLITASANGKKGHEALKLIMETLDAKFTKEATLLIQGVKGKVNVSGDIINEETKIVLQNFISSFKNQLNK